MTAERRVDRREVLDRVLAGVEPLRAGRSEAQVRRGTRPPAVVTPRWYLREGGGYERRAPEFDARRALLARTSAAGRNAALADWPESRSGGKPAPKSLPPQLVPVYERLRSCFVEPAKAVDSWWRMATEGARRERGKDGRPVWRLPNLAYAKWILRIRPVAFGPVTRGAFELAGDRAFERELKKLIPPVSAEHHRLDRAEIDVDMLQTIMRRSAQARTSRRHRSDRVRAAWELKRLAGMVDEGLGKGTDRARRILDLARRIEIPPALPVKPPAILPQVVPAAITEMGKSLADRLAEIARGLRPKDRGGRGD